MLYPLGYGGALPIFRLANDNQQRPFAIPSAVISAIWLYFGSLSPFSLLRKQDTRFRRACCTPKCLSRNMQDSTFCLFVGVNPSS